MLESEWGPVGTSRNEGGRVGMSGNEWEWVGTGDIEGERVKTSGKEWERVGSQGQKKAFKYSDFGLDFLRGMWYFFLLWDRKFG